MKNLRTEIIINGSAEKVWTVLTDFEKYPEWNPFIVSITGKPDVGSTIRAELKNGSSTSVFKPEVMVFEKNKAFEWLGSLPVPGIFNGHHCFHIESISANQVKFIQEENFSGLLAGIIMNKIGEQTRAGFISMNKALKERAEK